MVKDFNTFINRRKLKVNSNIIKKFLIVLRDDDWKRVRAIASPTFSSGKLKKMFTLIDDCVDGVLKKLEEFAVNGNEVDLKWLFGSYTMNVIAKCAFATDTNALEDKNNPFVKNAYNVVNVPLWRQIFFTLTPAFVLNLLNFTIATPDSAKFFINVAKHVLKDRKSNPDSAKYNDFLQLLVDAEKPNDSILEEMSESPDEMIANAKTFKLNSSEYKKLDEDEIIANIVIFLVAGYETTASLLSFGTYNLALNPETQEKLYEEIKNCKELNYDTVSKLPFLDAVICETLRLQNPVTRVEREANDDYVLGDTGITLNRHSIVAIPIHAIHHDPEYFPNPHQFRPERFYGEEKQNIKPYTYLPFGGGPRYVIYDLLIIKMTLNFFSSGIVLE
jgi:cytochrome P450 family 3 subfamily A